MSLGARAWALLGMASCVAAVVPCDEVAWAQASEQGPDQGELLGQARAAERQGRAQEAAGLYRAARDVDASSRLGARAARRLEWLEARSEQDYEPLSALLRVRGDRDLTATELAAFEARIDGFAEGIVRGEARQTVAEAWLQLGDAVAATRAFRLWLAERELSPRDRERALAGLARGLRAAGDDEGALEALGAAGLADGDAATSIRSDSRARVGRVVAWLWLALFALLALLAGGRDAWLPAQLRRTFGPTALLVAAWVLLGPGLLATTWDHDVADTFERLALGSALVLALAAVAGSGLANRQASARRRFALGGGAVLAQFAVAYLVVDSAGALLSFTP